VVKCPRCGFFSYPGHVKCQRCGTGLVPASRSPSVAAGTSSITQPGPVSQDGEKATGPSSATTDSIRNNASDEPPQDKRAETVSDNFDLGLPPDPREHPVAEATPAQGQEPAPWRQELSERVSTFRQRRARLRNEPPREETLDFEFERSETKPAAEPEVEKILEFPQNAVSLDADIASREALESDGRDSGAETPARGEEGLEILDSAQPGAEGFAVEPTSPAGSRLEIVVGPSEVDATAAASPPELEAFPVAPIGRRFMAGLADGLVLLLGAGLFTLIFRSAGGRFTLIPLNFAVVAVIGIIFVWTYFGFFTVLAFSTPGQAWMGIEVRNMEGRPPTPPESCLRAFGYLVSLSAFMIGFFWALVDSDSLTWHDRISGTFLTPAKKTAPVEGVKLKL